MECMEPIGKIIRERNIELDTFDPVAREGFAQFPIFILRNPNLTAGAKMTYAMFLSYAWHNDFCFPGQDRLASDMGMSRTSITAFIGELQKAGFVSIQRRGQGRTNLYTIHFQVRSRRPDVSRLTSRSQPFDGLRSARRLHSIEEYSD